LIQKDLQGGFILSNPYNTIFIYPILQKNRSDNRLQFGGQEVFRATPKTTELNLSLLE
jgi:hypothetical protein